jgi:hypothetical protein
MNASLIKYEPRGTDKLGLVWKGCADKAQRLGEQMRNSFGRWKCKHVQSHPPTRAWQGPLRMP